MAPEIGFKAEGTDFIDPESFMIGRVKNRNQTENP
jgi:hypothetical protein